MLGGDGWHTGGEVEFFQPQNAISKWYKLEKESIGWLTFFSQQNTCFVDWPKSKPAGLKDRRRALKGLLNSTCCTSFAASLGDAEVASNRD